MSQGLVTLLSSDEEPEDEVDVDEVEGEGHRARPPRALPTRIFGQAGDIASSVQASAKGTSSGGLDAALIGPKYLHSNATSHKWALGALAELVDNSVDEQPRGCTSVSLDIEDLGEGQRMLSVLDDGGGMDRVGLRKMLSLGMNEKHNTADSIGQNGNGFKSSSMRLGADALVFTISKDTHRLCVGMLSYTFLVATGAETVLIPLVEWDAHGEPAAADAHALRSILHWSPFTSVASLQREAERIGPHGTLVLIYNLWQTPDGLYELDFDADAADIRTRTDDAPSPAKKPQGRSGAAAADSSTAREASALAEAKYKGYLTSFRQYASILYKRPVVAISLRGLQVSHRSLAAHLTHSRQEHYRPNLPKPTAEDVRKGTVLCGEYVIDIGFVREAPHAAISGCNVYCRNRLIKAMWEVYRSPSSVGRGVVGVVEIDFIRCGLTRGFGRATPLDGPPARSPRPSQHPDGPPARSPRPSQHVDGPPARTCSCLWMARPLAAHASLTPDELPAPSILLPWPCTLAHHSPKGASDRPCLPPQASA